MCVFGSGFSRRCGSAGKFLNISDLANLDKVATCELVREA